MKKAKRVQRLEPGHDGRFKQGVIEVDNPYDDPEHSRVLTRVNARHDLLIHWWSRGSIDDAQYNAGQRLQMIRYHAEIGAPGTTNYDTDKVDVSGSCDLIADRAVTATKDLLNICAYLGKADYDLVTSLLCGNVKLADYGDTKTEREYVAKRARDALSYLAIYWGTKGPAYSPIRVDRADKAA